MRTSKTFNLLDDASAPPAEGGTRALEREHAQEGESPSVAELPATNGK
jgi:hypothetical protein